MCHLNQARLRKELLHQLALPEMKQLRVTGNSSWIGTFSVITALYTEDITLKSHYATEQ